MKETPALRDIRRLQLSTELLIPRLPLTRLIREIILQHCAHPDGLRVQRAALDCLQESAELYLTQLFEDAYRCTLHRDRVTLIVKDYQLARYLRGKSDPGNR